MRLIIPFQETSLSDLPEVGGKNSSLGEMIRELTQKGVKIPDGFSTTVSAYLQFLKENHLIEKIYDLLEKTDVDNVKQLQETGAKIREMVLNAEFNADFIEAITNAYQELSAIDATVAVRSSATSEDLPEASFAGQQDSFVNVRGIDEVITCIKRVFSSLFTNRAIAYRVHNNFPHEKVGISAGVQCMAHSGESSSGVIFTVDTESGFDKTIFITAVYGLGEGIVSGQINPDEYFVYKPNLASGKSAILSKKPGRKKVKFFERDQMCDVPEEERIKFCLNDDEITYLAKQAVIIEEHYGRPMDIEWAKDSRNGEIYIVQARPETVVSRAADITQRYEMKEQGKIITEGRSVGQRIGQGKARIIATPEHMDDLQKGEILVTDMTDPDWEPVMKRSSAIVTNRGGRTCHAAIVARELGIPAVVGCMNATDTIPDGQEVTVSCAEGETGRIYEGLLKFTKTSDDFTKLPKLPVKLCMILGNPDMAFSYQFLPNDGVGLARLEFIISNTIGIHPNALINYDKLEDKALKEEIRKRTAGYANPVEFYIEKLREGISTITAAFYPKPVILRFSDFKTNEYANLVGGKLYEPQEENPMIGYRGAGRYVHPDFAEAFRLEVEAVKRVYHDMALTNLSVMVPFVRTLNEGEMVIKLLDELGLRRGEIKIYVMCEIPSNAVLADQFLENYDGFSIGSNDLTQLTLGLDRNSEIIAAQFDERDPAVKTLLEKAIKACKEKQKYVGICGQGPSDHPDLAKWLLEQGIESISLSPDTLVATWKKLGAI